MNNGKFVIETSRLRIRGLTVNMSALKTLCVKGLTPYASSLHAVHHITMRWFIRRGEIAIPVSYDPPVFKVSEYVDLDKLEEKLKRLFGGKVKVKTGEECRADVTEYVKSGLQALELAVRGFLLGLIETLLLKKRHFRIMSEYRHRSERGVLSLPVIVWRYGNNVAQPEATIYIRRADFEKEKLVADVDIAVDVRLVKREELTSYKPGVYSGVFHYYGPRSSGSTSLAIVLNTSISNFKLSNITLYDYYKLFDEENAPDPDEKTVIIAKYADKLYRKHVKEYQYVRDVLEKACSKSLDKLAEELHSCIFTYGRALTSAMEVERIIKDCLRKACNSSLTESTLRFTPFPASHVRARVMDEEEEDELLNIDKKSVMIGELKRIVKEGLEQLFKNYSSRGLASYELFEEVRIESSEDYWGVEIVPGRFYENAAMQGLYPPLEVVRKILNIRGESVNIRFAVLDKQYRHVCVPWSPSAALRRGYGPIPGKRNVQLVVFYPRNIEEDYVRRAVDEIVKAYDGLNLGNIDYRLIGVSVEYRSMLGDVGGYCRSLVEREGYENVLKKYHFICVVDDSRPLASELYYNCKRIVAEVTRGAHTTVIKLSTIDKLAGNTRGKNEIAMNIALAVYKELLIQAAKTSRDELLATPWALCNPADGKGVTIYMGIDVGRAEEKEKANPAICTAIYDSYGSMLGATVLAAVKGEKVSGADIEKAVIRSLQLIGELDPPLEPRPSRVVILRDGYLNKEELVKQSIELEDGYKINVIAVGVVKKHDTRVYVRYGNGVYNVPPLTAIYLGSYVHRGYSAHHVLLISGHRSAGMERDSIPLYRPLLLVIPDMYVRGKRDALKLAIEIGKLAKLNFENAITGLGKLPLPIQLADILAKLVAHDLPIETLSIKARKRIPLERISAQPATRSSSKPSKHVRYRRKTTKRSVKRRR